ncbi:nuclease SbcCD subunit C [Xylocopilactobacillus apicola]|uniref:Nuclease SbcCD subunit C n=2 Tax=Xylocopilactobacillus apicola TaxID=2932184 RepID=A0AAU9DVC9_9LACO|nr:nuclease SbcCD subunit C [Xylocopilactobacillus apicola]
MRPIKLTMKYFGPYVFETVDFQTFDTSPLFLISGPTGAGKTTIFDALTFALYGKTSCNDERSGSDLRSKFAKPDQITSVELVFSHQNQVYTIYRRPQQLLAKKRGDGLTSMPAKAMLTIEKNGSKQEIEKLREVDQRIADLLQLDSAQFRQVVLLPQGDFRQFLGADSDNKEVLLRKLFGTQLYDRWANALKVKQSAHKKQIDEKMLELKMLKDQFDWQSCPKKDLPLGEILTAMENDNEQVKIKANTLQEASDDAKNQVKKLTEELAKLKALQEDFEMIAKAQIDLSSLKLKEAEMNKLAKEVSIDEWVQQHQDQYRNWQASLKEISKIDQKLAAATVELPAKIKQQNDFEAEKVKIDQKVPAIDQAKNELHDLLSAQVKISELNQAQSRVKSLTKQLENAESAVASSNCEVLKLEAALKELRNKEATEQLNEEIISTNDLNIRLTALEQDFKEYQELKHQVDQVKGQLVIQKDQLAVKAKLADEAQAKYDGLNDQALVSQITILASKLSDHTPCPVCGSKDHPAPANLQTKSKFDPKALAQADQARQLAQTQLVKAEKDVVQTKENIVELENKIAAILTKLFKQLPIPPDSNLEAELVKFRSQVQQAENKLKSDQKVHDLRQKELTAKEDELESKREELTKLKEQLNDFKNQRTENLTTAQILKKSLPTAALDQDLLEINIKELRQRLEEFTRNQKSNQETLARLNEQVTALKAQISALTTQKSDRQVETAQQEAAFQAALTKFSEIEDSADFLMHLDHLASLSQHKKDLEDFKNKKLRLNIELTNAKKRTSGKSEPDLEPVTKKLAAAQDHANQAQEQATIFEQRLKKNQQLMEKVKKLWQSNQVALQDAAELNSLVEIMTGSGPHKISLERYVLQAYLSQVLNVANNQLIKMTNGRYQFVLDHDQGSYKKNSGLEINVYDDQVGAVRSVHTLSGGESFLAALSLALALAEVIQAKSGGIRIDALFIDEGFGSLDSESLNDALSALRDLRGSSRLVGIISHVQSLLTQIPDQLQVRPNGTGISRLLETHLGE